MLSILVTVSCWVSTGATAMHMWASHYFIRLLNLWILADFNLAFSHKFTHSACFPTSCYLLYVYVAIEKTAVLEWRWLVQYVIQYQSEVWNHKYSRICTVSIHVVNKMNCVEYIHCTTRVQYKPGGLIGQVTNQTEFCMANFGNWSATNFYPWYYTSHWYMHQCKTNGQSLSMIHVYIVYSEIVYTWSYDPLKCPSDDPSTCPSHQAAGMIHSRPLTQTLEFVGGFVDKRSVLSLQVIVIFVIAHGCSPSDLAGLIPGCEYCWDAHMQDC